MMMYYLFNDSVFRLFNNKGVALYGGYWLGGDF